MVDSQGRHGHRVAEARERELLARVADGDEHALGSLYDLYGATVYGLAAAITHDHRVAEDTVADAFGQLWESARALLGEQRSVLAWLTRTVRETALPRRANTPVDVRAFAGLTIGDAAVGRALAELPLQQRAALELAYFGGLTKHDIARALGHSEATVSQWLAGALDALRLSTALHEAPPPVRRVATA